MPNSRLSCAPAGSRTPGIREFLPARHAFPKVEVDQRLIANACFLCKAPEVLNRDLVKPNRHLLLQTSGIGIAFGVGEVVMLPHFVHLASYSSRSCRSARRAEMSRITSRSRR